ncbi:glucose 1-dehydrogenase [Stackebrandtia soli]|uniref:glucose 1-dehydrogenase n=1 Tax=Stackebrandtia soli TaxID=1892856 RepID=UPI0039EACD44
MKAITVVPGEPDAVRVGDVDDPDGDGLLVEGLLLGVCGTDVDIIMHGYGEVPPEHQRLIVGHESLGSVLEAPSDSDFTPGDLVVGIVRRPDPVPCGPCAHGEWDYCRNGRYTERGIKGLDGYGSQRWRVEPEYAVKLDPALGDRGVLLEPASVTAKAWEQIDRFVERSSWRPESVLITGAGPIGLFAGLMGAQRGLDVHILDRVSDTRKAELAYELGATFHTGDLSELGFTPDVAIECTGFAPLAFDLPTVVGPDGVVCLAGISATGGKTTIDSDSVNNTMVLGNIVVFGTVSAARRHFEQAARSLARADQGWLSRLITRRVPIANYREALRRDHDDIKVVIDLQA